jgi:hypothetical protein
LKRFTCSDDQALSEVLGWSANREKWGDGGRMIESDGETPLALAKRRLLRPQAASAFDGNPETPCPSL